MAQNEEGEAGPALPGQLPQAPHVPDRQLPAPLGGEEAVLPRPGGAAVAQVVVPAHREAVAGQKVGGLLIAAHVLRHPVDDLYHGFRAALGSHARACTVWRPSAEG